MGYHGGNLAATYQTGSDEGRFPANVVHDGSPEVVEAFPVTAPGSFPATRGADKNRTTFGEFAGQSGLTARRTEAGSAARFFYSAKASKGDRASSKHPTVKPVSLMQWLARMVTPPGGLVLDPFAGSGTTGQAAALEGLRCVMIEREDEYAADIVRRFASPNLVPDAEKSEQKAQIKVDSP
jgi:hypothetical protein